MVKVLIVEDEAMLRDAFVLALGLKGYDVESAYDGQHAAGKLQKLRPDIILLDIIMPRMDGYAFLQDIKVQRAIKNVPVIAFSNISSEDKVGKILTLGAYKHVLKSSVSPADIDKIIKEVLLEK